MSELEDRYGAVLDVLLRLASGDFGARAEVTGEGDLADAVAAGVNMLGEEIEAHDERLQAAVRRQTHQLQDQNAQLAELERRRTHLVQNASHELRTPLTLILAPLEDELARDPANESLRLIDRNARRLLRLVNQLLDHQKLAAGRMELDCGPVALPDFLRVCADYFRSAAASHDVTFRTSVEGDADELWVWSEADALEKVIFNYLSNALKHTPVDGSIELGAARRGDGVRLWVRDTGPGVAPEDVERLFEVFVQAGDARTQHQGTGLGLALVRELVEAMGGTVGVDSSPGSGATFWCDLEPSVPGVQEADGYDLRGLGLADVEPVDGGAVEPGAPGGAAGTVLVVDDLADVRQVLARSIRRAGFGVLLARDGREALEVLTANPVDLVITDWMMPRMTGPELIEAIRADDALQGTPVVLLTARSDEESRLIGLGIGADAFLGKPFLDAELTSTVRNLVALKRREREVVALNRHLADDVLKRYLPAQLVDQLVGREAEDMVRPREMPVTVLFADLVGFTELTEQLEPDEVTSLLNTYFTNMTEVAFEHGGTVDKFLGDGLMLLFGAPTGMLPADQVTRAVACARAIHQRLQETAEETFLDTARIGIHHGPAIVGSIGSALRSDFTAVGRTVNLASRIESTCPPGRTWVSAAVRDLVPSGTTTSAGTHVLKGIGAVELFEVQ